MKNLWTAVILLVVIACLVLFLIFLNKEKPFKEEDRVLYSYKDKEVDEIRIEFDNVSISFAKEKGSWVMTKPVPYKIDKDIVGSLENRLKDFLAARVLEEHGRDLDKYGLDTPSGVISFRLNDGTENVLLIGDKTASGIQYYAKDSARENIYILGSYDVESFLRPYEQFRDRTILAVAPDLINLLSFEANAAGGFRLECDDSGKWRFIEPLEMNARDDAVKEILGSILNIRVKDFIADRAEDLSIYGLETPQYVLEMHDKNQDSQTIYFGMTDEEKHEIFIRVDDNKEIYTLSIDLFDPGRIKIGDLMAENPLSVSIENVNKVTIIDNDSDVEFERDISAREDLFLYKGKPVNNEYFTALFVNIMALSAEGYDPENPGGRPGLTVILELKGNAGLIKADFVKRDDSSYYMTVNDKPRPFFIGARKVDLVKKWKERVLEGM